MGIKYSFPPTDATCKGPQRSKATSSRASRFFSISLLKGHWVCLPRIQSLHLPCIFDPEIVGPSTSPSFAILWMVDGLQWAKQRCHCSRETGSTLPCPHIPGGMLLFHIFCYGFHIFYYGIHTFSHGFHIFYHGFHTFSHGFHIIPHGFHIILLWIPQLFTWIPHYSTMDSTTFHLESTSFHMDSTTFHMDSTSFHMDSTTFHMDSVRYVPRSAELDAAARDGIGMRDGTGVRKVTKQEERTYCQGITLGPRESQS